MVTIKSRYNKEIDRIEVELLLEDEDEAPIEKETEGITCMTARFAECFGKVDAIGYLRGIIADIEDGNALVDGINIVKGEVETDGETEEE